MRNLFKLALNFRIVCIDYTSQALSIFLISISIFVVFFFVSIKYNRLHCHLYVIIDYYVIFAKEGKEKEI